MNESVLARSTVLAALARAPGWASTTEIAEGLPYCRGHVRNILFALHNEGRVEREERDSYAGPGFLYVWRWKSVTERPPAPRQDVA